jgi:hypothetical protein
MLVVKVVMVMEPLHRMSLRPYHLSLRVSCRLAR